MKRTGNHMRHTHRNPPGQIQTRRQAALIEVRGAVLKVSLPKGLRLKRAISLQTIGRHCANRGPDMIHPPGSRLGHNCLDLKSLSDSYR